MSKVQFGGLKYLERRGKRWILSNALYEIFKELIKIGMSGTLRILVLREPIIQMTLENFTLCYRPTHKYNEQSLLYKVYRKDGYMGSKGKLVITKGWDKGKGRYWWWWLTVNDQLPFWMTIPVLESTDDWENIKILTLILILSSKMIFYWR